MKTLIKYLSIALFLGLVAWALLYIGSEENSINLRDRDWGIAKDNPIGRMR